MSRPIGFRHSIATINKIKKSNTGKRRTQETKNNISKSLKGKTKGIKHKPMSDETKKKLSLANIGKKGYWTGKKRKPFTKETRMKMSRTRATMIREKSNGWKGGKITHHGYTMRYVPEHPYKQKHGYVLEHRLIMERHIGRILLPTEIVHHINCDIKDNCIENLMLFSTDSEHQKHHWNKRKNLI